MCCWKSATAATKCAWSTNNCIFFHGKTPAGNSGGGFTLSALFALFTLFTLFTLFALFALFALFTLMGA